MSYFRKYKFFLVSFLFLFLYFILLCFSNFFLFEMNSFSSLFLLFNLILLE
jgi:hypothetical protein